MNKYKQTPSQTVGPYFAYGLTPEQYLFDFKSLANNTLDGTNTETITISGRIFDGDGLVISDAMVEIWDAQNTLFGRFGTGTRVDSSYIFYTKKPKKGTNNQSRERLVVGTKYFRAKNYNRMY